MSHLTKLCCFRTAKIHPTTLSWRKLGLLFVLLTPSVAFAQEFMVTSILGKLVDLLQSDVARVIFVLSLIGIGYGWLYLGKIPKAQAIAAIIGIGIVFSASFIAQKLGIGGF